MKACDICKREVKDLYNVIEECRVYGVKEICLSCKNHIEKVSFEMTAAAKKIVKQINQSWFMNFYENYIKDTWKKIESKKRPTVND